MSPCLHALFSLDPRGGYFLQDDMVRTVTHLCQERDAASKLHALSVGLKKSESETIENIAYAYRVMCSHVREKFDAISKQSRANRATGGPLDVVFQALTSSATGTRRASSAS
eukprot:7188871-Pyramimonas_sp.AAC.1